MSRFAPPNVAMSAATCWRANIPKESKVDAKKLSSLTLEERQDLQNILASVGHFLRRDREGKLELWTSSLDGEDTGPRGSGETFDSVEEAYAKIFRNTGPD
jgi:hypothetical protein